MDVELLSSGGECNFGSTLRQSVKSLTFNVKFITPLLIGGGEKDQYGKTILLDENGLSGKALRGCWRFWCRAVIGGMIPDISRDDLYKLESEIFGSAKSDNGAKFGLIIDNNEEQQQISRINLGFRDRNNNWAYSKGFVEGASYSITIIPRSTMLDNHINILFCTIWLWGNLGSVGKRERRGFGSPILYQEYLSKWGELSKYDQLMLKEFLSDKFSIDWVKTANIENTDDSKLIKISTETNSLALRLNNERNRAHLEINGVRTNYLIAKAEGNILNIYYDPFSFQNEAKTDIILPLEEEFNNVNSLKNHLIAGLQNVWSAYKEWISKKISPESDLLTYNFVEEDISILSAPIEARFFILQSFGQIAAGNLGFTNRDRAIKAVHGTSSCDELGWARRNNRMSSPVFIRFHKLITNNIVELLPIFTWCKQSGFQDKEDCARNYLAGINSDNTPVFTKYLNEDLL